MPILRKNPSRWAPILPALYTEFPSRLPEAIVGIWKHTPSRPESGLGYVVSHIFRTDLSRHTDACTPK